MSELRTVGSELINDPDKKRARILELAGIKKNTSKPINENNIRTKKSNETILHKATASNGVTYGIVQEGKHVYIKEAINNTFEYIGGVQNLREHSYKAFADALKHLNLLFKDINMVTETTGGTDILSEGYKLKVGGGPHDDSMGTVDPAPMGDPDAMDEPALEPDMSGPDELEDTEPEDGDSSEKKIQKLSGKLAQEIRDAEEGEIDDNLAKSVTNTVLSATEEILEPESKEEIISRLEGEEEEAPMGEPGDESVSDEMPDMPDNDEDLTMETEWMDDDVVIDKTLDSAEIAEEAEMSIQEIEDMINNDSVEEHTEDDNGMGAVHDLESDTDAMEQDPYTLYEQAVEAIMGKAMKSGTLEECNIYMTGVWDKMAADFKNKKYMAYGELAERSLNETAIDEHNVSQDPSPMSKAGDHEAGAPERESEGLVAPKVDVKPGEIVNENADASPNLPSTPVSNPGEEKRNPSKDTLPKKGTDQSEAGNDKKTAENIPAMPVNNPGEETQEKGSETLPKMGTTQSEAGNDKKTAENIPTMPVNNPGEEKMETSSGSLPKKGTTKTEAGNDKKTAENIPAMPENNPGEEKMEESSSDTLPKKGTTQSEAGNDKKTAENVPAMPENNPGEEKMEKGSDKLPKKGTDKTEAGSDKKTAENIPAMPENNPGEEKMEKVVNEGEAPLCEKCEKAECACESEEINEAVTFLKEKINFIKSRLED